MNHSTAPADLSDSITATKAPTSESHHLKRDNTEPKTHVSDALGTMPIPALYLRFAELLTCIISLLIILNWSFITPKPTSEEA